MLKIMPRYYFGYYASVITLAVSRDDEATFHVIFRTPLATHMAFC